MWRSKCSEASVAQKERCEHCSRFIVTRVTFPVLWRCRDVISLLQAIASCHFWLPLARMCCGPTRCCLQSHKPCRSVWKYVSFLHMSGLRSKIKAILTHSFCLEN